MHSSSIFAVCTTFAGLVHGLNVLITNDDGFGTSNIRELYKQLRSLGHDCYIVASATDQSGTGGLIEFTTSPKLQNDGDWGIVNRGAPSLGRDPIDGHIWYYNGTPATQVIVALDYVLPTFADFKVPDVVLSGPNVGSTLGPFLYNIPGTIGAAYAAIERGIPAIAFASGNRVPIPYFWVNASTPAGLQDPATITGRLAAAFVQALAAKAGGSPLLPKGYGINVNLPLITSYTSDQCINPPFILAHMGGDVTGAQAAYNTKTGLFAYENAVGQARNNSNGIPTERDVVNSGCKSAVTVFTVEYDVHDNRVCINTTDLTVVVPVIVQVNGSTPLVPGLGANASFIGNQSHPSTTPRPPVDGNMGAKLQGSITVLALGLGAVAMIM